MDFLVCSNNSCTSTVHCLLVAVTLYALPSHVHSDQDREYMYMYVTVFQVRPELGSMKSI